MSFELYEYKIEDLGKVITGKTPPSKISDAFSAQGIPFVTPKDMDGRRLIDKTERYLSSQGVEAVRNCLLPQNSIAVSCIGSDMGKTVLLPGESITNQQINAIVVDSEHFDYTYVYYYLSTLQDDFKAIAGGSATPILNKGHFSQFKVSLPVKPVQNKIALILDSLDTKIEVNTEINQTLEQMAQALFKSWFVDFEPVKAKITALEAGGSQEDATFAAMTAISGKDADALAVFEREHPEQYAELQATAELFPSAMQDSELGEIPEGWCVSNMKDNVDVRDGTHASPKASDSGYHLVTSKNITSGYLDRRSCYYISDADYYEVNKRSRVSHGDILISMIGTVGALYFVAEKSVDYAIKNIGLIRTSEKHDLQSFIFYYLKGKSGVDYINSRLAGTTQKYISLKQLREIPLVIPTKDVLTAFNKKSFLHEIHANKEISETLASIRDTLLPKLLSGEITLPEAEQAVSEAENV